MSEVCGFNPVARPRDLCRQTRLLRLGQCKPRTGSWLIRSRLGAKLASNTREDSSAYNLQLRSRREASTRIRAIPLCIHCSLSTCITIRTSSPRGSGRRRLRVCSISTPPNRHAWRRPYRRSCAMHSGMPVTDQCVSTSTPMPVRSASSSTSTIPGPGSRSSPTCSSGRYQSSTGMGMGIVGARRLMDQFAIESDQQRDSRRDGKVFLRRGRRW